MKIKEWIEDHRISWIIILFGIGIGIGLLQATLLGVELRQSLRMSFIYGSLLPIVEVCSGGSGVN